MYVCACCRYSGVFEAVDIRKKGFPFKLTYKQFFYRYRSQKPGISASDVTKASKCVSVCLFFG